MYVFWAILHTVRKVLADIAAQYFTDEAIAKARCDVKFSQIEGSGSVISYISNSAEL